MIETQVQWTGPKLEVRFVDLTFVALQSGQEQIYCIYITERTSVTHLAFFSLHSFNLNSKMAQVQETSKAMAGPGQESDLASPTSREVVEQQLSVAKTVLLQAVDLIDNHLTSDEQLTTHSKYMPGSTIGILLYHTLSTKA